MKRRLTGCLLLAVGNLIFATILQADDRLPVPAAAEIAKAKVDLKEIFQSDYAKAKPADRAALANKLFDESAKAGQTALSRYVMLRESCDIAAKAGDVVAMMRAAREIAKVFDVSTGEVKSSAAAQLVLTTMTPQAARAAVDILLSAADETRQADDWSATIKILTIAEAAARRGQSAPAAVMVRERIKQAEAWQAEAAKVAEQFKTLKENPEDPAANFAVGRFLCLVKEDWESGVKLLVKSADGPWKMAAERDVNAAGGDKSDQLAAADTWYSMIESAEPAAKLAFQMRAHHWYSQVISKLDGLQQIQAKKRATDLQTAIDTRGGKVQQWNLIRLAIINKRLNRWPLPGSGRSDTVFEELPPEGGVLIGFNYAATTSGIIFPTHLQAIYLTAAGEITGKMYANTSRVVSLQTVKARPGYAVGALSVRKGGWLDAVKPTFMRMTKDGLDTKDQYDGPQIGGDGGVASSLGGDGNFVVGIHGVVSSGGNPSTVSIISLAPATGTAKN